MPVPPETAKHKILPGLLELAVPIRRLKPDPHPVMLHDEENLEAIKAGLELGQHAPLVVQAFDNPGRGALGIVKCGNGRLKAAKELGWTWIAALIVDEGDVEARARALVDNRAGELAEWDVDVLRGELDALVEQGRRLRELGFSEDDRRRMADAVDQVRSRGGARRAGRSRVSLTLKMLPKQRGELEAAADRAGEDSLPDWALTVLLEVARGQMVRSD